jgi:hypothetical protein
MIIRRPLVTLNLLVLAAALLLAGNVVLLRPWLPSLTWDTVAPVVTCPDLMAPNCIEIFLGP